MCSKRRGYRKYYSHPPKGGRLWKAKNAYSYIKKKKLNHKAQPESGGFECSNHDGFLGFDVPPLDKHECLRKKLYHKAQPVSGVFECSNHDGFLGFDVPPLDKHECLRYPNDDTNTPKQLASKSPSHEHMNMKEVTAIPLIDCALIHPQYMPASDFKQPIRVLSLFDGISTGMYALDELGVENEVYYSCEIDKSALKVQKYRYYNRITMLGSVEALTNDKIKSLGRIDLLLAGSPCKDLSLVNPTRGGLHGQDSTGHLFFEFTRVLDTLLQISKETDSVLYWLLENTSHMERATCNEMSRHLGCDPVTRCASIHNLMRRKRKFWGSIPGITTPPNSYTCSQATLNDILRPYRHANVRILPTLTTTSHSERSGKDKRLPVTEDGHDTPLFVTEKELAFGFRESFTDGPNLSPAQRKKLLGRAWSVHVVKDLLRPLTNIFRTTLLHT